MQLEEGEISDDDINPYIPLERPQMLHQMPVATKSIVDDEEDDDLFARKSVKTGVDFGSSDSDSDDDLIAGKRLRISQPVSNKYSIWTKDPNDFITDVLDQIGMEETPENDRNVENYLERKWKPERHRKRKVPKAANGDVLHPAAEPKQLDPLTVTEENTSEEVAADIALKLDEPNYLLVLKIVETLGKPKAIELFQATKDIENDGGMLVLSGTRKRTSGGIFIFLVRDDKDITGVQRNEIFEMNKSLPVLKKKRRRNGKDKTKHLKDQMSNPPPSPDTEAELPNLPERRDIILYDNIFF